MGKRSGTTTIDAVARQAEVSRATVSRVMNGRFVGDPAVAERVRAVAARLDYQPSPLARSLALGRTHTVAFVVPDIGNPAFQAVLASLTRAAAADGYRVLVADTAEDATVEREIVTDIRRRSDSIVLCAPRMAESELRALASELAPLVVINRPSPDDVTPSLAIDYRTGIRQLAQHLYDLGHREIVYVAGPGASASNARRLEGLEAFAADAPDAVVHRVMAGVSIDSGTEVVDEVLATGATAALAFNDLVAIGLLTALTDRGIDVPGRFSVSGFDDIPFARFVSPALTTAAVEHDRLGSVAWTRLHAMIEGERTEHEELFAPHLAVRASTAAPPA